MDNNEKLKKAVIQALVENEYQDNTNYNDIADSVVRLYNYQLLQAINNIGTVNNQTNINNHTGDLKL